MNDAARPGHFTARLVASHHDQTLSVALLAFSEGDDLSSRALIFQRALGEDGTALPEEAWSVSTELGATWYGGIVSWRLDGSSLRLDLTDEAADALDVPDAITVELADDVVEQVDAALRWILGAGTTPLPDVFAPTR